MQPFFHYTIFTIYFHVKTLFCIIILPNVKNYLLRRVCRKRGLVKTDKKTFVAMFAFLVISGVLGTVLTFIPINSIFMLGVVIIGFAVLYLPTAFIIDRRFIK